MSDPKFTSTFIVFREGRFRWVAKGKTVHAEWYNDFWWYRGRGLTRRGAIRKVKREFRKYVRKMAWRANQEQIEVTL